MARAYISLLTLQTRLGPHGPLFCGRVGTNSRKTQRRSVSYRGLLQVSGIFAGLAVFLSLLLAFQHVRHYNSPSLQRYIVRVLLFVPVRPILVLASTPPETLSFLSFVCLRMLSDFLHRLLALASLQRFTALLRLAEGLVRAVCVQSCLASSPPLLLLVRIPFSFFADMGLSPFFCLSLLLLPPATNHTRSFLSTCCCSTFLNTKVRLVF